MSDRETRRAKGIDFWIDRCDTAENIIENFQSCTNYVLDSIGFEDGKFIVQDEVLFKKGVSKLKLEDNIKGTHLEIPKYQQG